MIGRKTMKDTYGKYYKSVRSVGLGIAHEYFEVRVIKSKGRFRQSNDSKTASVENR